MKSGGKSATPPVAGVLTLSCAEASAAAGFAIGDLNDAAKAARCLLDSPGHSAVAIVLNEETLHPRTGDPAEPVPCRPPEAAGALEALQVSLAVLAVRLATDNDSRATGHADAVVGAGQGASLACVSEVVETIAHQGETAGSKLRSLSSLLAELAPSHRTGRTVVFTNGCFDVIHRGHIEYLQFCKRQGDLVVVGLNSDSSVRALKGPERPVNKENDRAAVLSGLETVDFVTLFDELDPLELIKQIRPDVLIKGADWKPENVIGRDVVESYGGKLMLAPLVEGRSSSKTIEKMRAVSTKTNENDLQG